MAAVPLERRLLDVALGDPAADDFTWARRRRGQTSRNRPIVRETRAITTPSTRPMRCISLCWLTPRMSSHRAYDGESSRLSGSGSISTRVGRSCLVLVRGSTATVGACRFQSSDETTKAGLTQPCSRPRGSPRSSSHSSPRRASVTVEAVAQGALPDRVLLQCPRVPGQGLPRLTPELRRLQSLQGFVDHVTDRAAALSRQRCGARARLLGNPHCCRHRASIRLRMRLRTHPRHRRRLRSRPRRSSGCSSAVNRASPRRSSPTLTLELIDAAVAAGYVATASRGTRRGSATSAADRWSATPSVVPTARGCGTAPGTTVLSTWRCSSPVSRSVPVAGRGGHHSR